MGQLLTERGTACHLPRKKGCFARGRTVFFGELLQKEVVCGNERPAQGRNKGHTS